VDSMMLVGLGKKVSGGTRPRLSWGRSVLSRRDNSAPKAGLRCRLYVKRQLVLSKTDLGKVKEVPPEKIAPNWHRAEAHSQFEIPKLLVTEFDPMKPRLDESPKRCLVPLDLSVHQGQPDVFENCPVEKRIGCSGV